MKSCIQSKIKQQAAKLVNEFCGWELMNSAITPIDMAQIRGQLHVVRALEVAAARCHSIALMGAPGTGKAMLACTLPTFLPHSNWYGSEPEDDTIEAVREQTKVFLRDVQRWNRSQLTQIWKAYRSMMVIATIELCPCGYHGHPLLECTCNVWQLVHYQKNMVPSSMSAISTLRSLLQPERSSLIRADVNLLKRSSFALRRHIRRRNTEE